ncbi:MAG: acyl carrier protein [Pseudomonadota bacterium]
MSKDQTTQDLRNFIVEDAQTTADDPGLTLDVHLFDSGYLDSLGVVRLIAFIEERFGVVLDEEDLFSEEFTYISGIADLILNQSSSAA